MPISILVIRIEDLAKETIALSSWKLESYSSISFQFQPNLFTLHILYTLYETLLLDWMIANLE